MHDDDKLVLPKLKITYSYMSTSQKYGMHVTLEKSSEIKYSFRLTCISASLWRNKRAVLITLHTDFTSSDTNY